MKLDSGYAIYHWRRYREHYLKDGNTLYSHSGITPDEPDSDDSKPLTDLTGREQKLITGDRPDSSNLCVQCRSIASQNDLIPKYISDEVPSFPCPKCGKDGVCISSILGLGHIEHEDGDRHRFDLCLYEQWQRGGTPEELNLIRK